MRQKMSDRLKFRVWDTKDKCWFKIDIDNWESGKICASLCYPNNEKDPTILELKNCNRFIWQQCTGLKDKNGKLIFEGDVVKHDNGLLNDIRWCQPLSQFVRSYYGSDNDLFYDGYKNMEIEVIGNRFENPELLEGGK
jgi:hypothetical protein